MTIEKTISALRAKAGMSKEQFAEIFGVSANEVQKWESGETVPELESLIKISKQFDISIETLIMDSGLKATEDFNYKNDVKPEYENIAVWESYSSDLLTEYSQSIDEGLDISAYEELFTAVSRLPKNEIKKKLADIIFEIVRNAKTVDGYKYTEPSTIEEIKNLRAEAVKLPEADKKKLENKIYGAWLGRICGCLLGKTVEGIRTSEFIPFLKETNNYPMHRYILHSDLNKEITDKYKYPLVTRCYADKVDGMPADDDTNYTVLAQKLIEKHGRDFTSKDVADIWISLQSKNAYCTAERVAFCNFIKGYEPPKSAVYQNPYREYIGAQIRADYFGYINPGNPELAAEMAFRDASISHIKNGIYGEMFVAAMLAAAACTDDIKVIIKSGLAQVPYTSRLYAEVSEVLSGYENGVSQEKCFENIHKKYNEYTGYGWCHTISNAMIVAASLLYGKGDYGKSICMAVETGFDTDCNGATVGSVIGMANGAETIDEVWSKPINDTLHTSIFGVGTVKISEVVKKTLEHLK